MGRLTSKVPLRCRRLIWALGAVATLLAAGCSAATPAGPAPGAATSGPAVVPTQSPTAAHAPTPLASPTSTATASSNVSPTVQAKELQAKFAAQGCTTFDPLPTGLPGFTCEFGNQFSLPTVAVTVWGASATTAARTSASADSSQVVIQSGDVVVLVQARKGSSDARQITALVIEAIGGKVVS